MLTKSQLNPILSAQPNLKWANKKVYNSAALIIDGSYHLFFRAIGVDYISRIGHAVSTDGTHFEVQDKAIFEPLEEWEVKGCEDPRITKIDDLFFMAYTAYDGLAARVATTTTTDFINWTARTIAFPEWREGQWVSPGQKAWSKAAALFPEKVNGKYHLFFGDDAIWQAYSDDLVSWNPVIEPILEPREGFFDCSYIEMGPPPILTERGWLIIYHGIDGIDNGRVYRLGAAIFDHDNPSKLIWRCKSPILEPTAQHERVGQIDIIDGGMERLSKLSNEELVQLSDAGSLPQAVFCCGAVINDGLIHIYYSGSDTVLCLATCTIGDLLTY